MNRLYWIALLMLLLCVPASGAEKTQFEIGPLQLAHTYTQEIKVKEYYISEKLDGVRARWTGSVLLTRNGNRIYTPAWFTRHWPDTAMDGELWTTRGDFEHIASVVLKDIPDRRWQKVKMMVFDLPIENLPFAARVEKMKRLIEGVDNPSLLMIPQFTLKSVTALEDKIDAITAAGGEGLMLHHQQAFYQAGRAHHLLKAKRYDDDEAKVIAYREGRGKFAGMMGALLVETRGGKQFKIGSGFSHNDRLHPPPIGSWITFKYYGLTQRGIPRFASFLHVRPEKERP